MPMAMEKRPLVVFSRNDPPVLSADTGNCPTRERFSVRYFFSSGVWGRSNLSSVAMSHTWASVM